jgi:hypothetical protein
MQEIATVAQRLASAVLKFALPDAGLPDRFLDFVEQRLTKRKGKLEQVPVSPSYEQVLQKS